MNPGVYESIPIEEYHAGAGYSSSQLKTINKSPYQFHYDYIEQREPPDLTRWGNTRRPLALGGATAALADGEEVFQRGYYILPEDLSKLNKNTSDKINKKTGEITRGFKDAFADATRNNPDKTVILWTEYEQAQGINKAIHSHPDAWTREQLKSFFDNKDLRAECSFYWRDSETGLLIKTRPDLVIRRALCADIKTTADCGSWTFAKRILEMGHHVQAAMGLDIINHIDKCAIENWLLIVVEQQPPHDVAVYQLGKPTLAKGYEKYRHALRTLAGCLKTNTWPGKQAGIETIDIPVYALNEETPDVAIPTADKNTGVVR